MSVRWIKNPKPKQAGLFIKDICSCLCTFYNNGKANVMLIDSVLTDEKYRRQGYGAKLMDEAIKLAKKMNVDSVELNVNKDNIAAKKLYEKLGFEKTKKDYYRIILNKWQI